MGPNVWLDYFYFSTTWALKNIYIRLTQKQWHLFAVSYGCIINLYKYLIQEKLGML